MKCQVWIRMKQYINSLKMNEVFTRKQLINECHDKYNELREVTSEKVSLYRYYLTKIGLVKVLKKGTYQKLANIPEKISVNLLKKISRENYHNSWKVWFVPLHDRLGVTEEELYGGVGEMETQRVVAPL